jgi:hypothetical protein
VPATCGAATDSASCASFSSVNTGRSLIQAKSSSASITVDGIQANWIILKSGTGDIYGSELLVEVRSHFRTAWTSGSSFHESLS